MTDRIPTQVLDNGAIRYAVYDEQGAFLRYEWIKPADEPTDEGTPLNKANLLQDSTASLLGLQEDDPTVDDAFEQIAKDNGAIGTLRAALAPLDDRWLLCDGSFIKDADYPELAPMLPDRLTDLAGYPTVSLPQGGLAGSLSTNSPVIYYVNGYYIVGGNRGVWYTQSLSEPWKEVKITSSTTLRDNPVGYGNGIWYAYSDSSDYVYVSTASDISGPWTTPARVTRSSGSHFDSYFFHSIYKAPYYISAYPLSSAYERLVYSTNVQSGYVLVSTGNMDANGVFNSVWATQDYIIVNWAPLTGTSPNKLFFATSPDETWTSINGVACIGYFKGQYVTADISRDTDGNKMAAYGDIWIGSTPGAKTKKLCHLSNISVGNQGDTEKAIYSQALNALLIDKSAVIYFDDESEVKNVYEQTTVNSATFVGNDNGMLICTAKSSAGLHYMSPVEAQSILPSAEIPVGELYVKALH